MDYFQDKINSIQYRNKMKRGYLVLLILAVFLSGCATPHFRANPLLGQKIGSISTIAVMPMDVEVYKVTAGGVRELVDEFSNEAKSNIKAALQKELTSKRNFHLVYLPELEELKDKDFKQKVKEASLLFGAVNTSILMHTYKKEVFRLGIVPPSELSALRYQGVFKSKIENFDYTLGPQVKIFAESKNVDSLLFIKGADYLSTGGRIALMTWVSILEAVAGGSYSNKSAGPPHLFVALVNIETGDVLWYDFCSVEIGYNFRNPESVNRFVRHLLRNFPER